MREFAVKQDGSQNQTASDHFHPKTVSHSPARFHWQGASDNQSMQRLLVQGIAPAQQRTTEREGKCDYPGITPNMKSSSGPAKTPDIVNEALSSSGQPLERTVREQMEADFGHDFSRVRIHTGERAAESAEAVGAHAYTLGPNIVFGTGRYAPATREGQLLLAHELMHVAEQSADAPQRLSRQPDDKQATKEEKERAKLLAEFTDGAGFSDKRLHQINDAMGAFTLNQLHAMQKAGLRFWPGDSLPPEFKDRVAFDIEKFKKGQDDVMIKTPGEYLDKIRVIRLADRATTANIRHELAHAWDHVQGGKVKPVHNLNDKEFEKAQKENPPLRSTTDEKRKTLETHDGKTKEVKLTIAEMLDRYRQWKLREQCFDGPSTRESYSKMSPREFYAEGYAVYHSGDEFQQARLLFYAPELYELLEAESKELGLPVADRSKVQQSMKEQNFPSQ